MTQAIRALDEDCVCVVGRHVDEGQAIAPGTPLLDIMTSGGVKTFYSEGWGVVAHIEGKRIFSNADAGFADNGFANDDDWRIDGSSEMDSMFDGHSVLCHIVSRGDYNSIKGGKPHPSTSRSVANAKAEGRLLPTFG